MKKMNKVELQKAIEMEAKKFMKETYGVNIDIPFRVSSQLKRALGLFLSHHYQVGAFPLPLSLDQRIKADELYVDNIPMIHEGEETMVREVMVDRGYTPTEGSKHLLSRIRVHRRSKKGKATHVMFAKEITIAWNTYDKIGWDAMVEVLKHELIHFYMFATGRQYRDGQDDFESELKRLDVRFVEGTINSRTMHRYECETCGCAYHKHVRINVSREQHKCSRYRCQGINEGRLVYVGEREEKITLDGIASNYWLTRMES